MAATELKRELAALKSAGENGGGNLAAHETHESPRGAARRLRNNAPAVSSSMANGAVTAAARRSAGISSVCANGGK